jgi:hypothetical protein|tara:strand:+ start:446 stop:574 length:129 start_codon:yes stop_codon:yes gene_type:complete
MKEWTTKEELGLIVHAVVRMIPVMIAVVFVIVLGFKLLGKTI